MRGRIAALILVLWTSSTRVHADPFADFRIPDHSWRTGTVSGSASGNWSTWNNSPDQSNDRSLNSGLRGGVTFNHDADALQHEIGIDLRATASARLEQSDWVRTFERQHRDTQNQYYGQEWHLYGALRAYPWNMPLGLEAEASTSGRYAQGWSGTDESSESLATPGSRQETRVRADQHESEYTAILTSAAGFGRVRDATVVFDVHLLEERLQAAGALARPLSAAAREKLAALLYLEPDYAYAHERALRFFWRDVDELLRADSCLAAGGLDAFSLMRVLESYQPLRGAAFARLRGWFAGPVARAEHYHLVQRQDATQEVRQLEPGLQPIVTTESRSDYSENSRDRFMLGGRLAYHRPLGWRWQADLFTQALAPMRPGEEGFQCVNSARLIWLVADRWKASAAIDQSRTVFEPRGTDELENDSWGVTWSADLGFYVEDRTDLYAELRQDQAREMRRVGDSPTYRRDTSLNLGVRYRFMGALDAAGLITPQRLLH